MDREFIKRVLEFDKKYKLDTNDPTFGNLIFMTLGSCGESGEIGNAVRKLWSIIGDDQVAIETKIKQILESDDCFCVKEKKLIEDIGIEIVDTLIYIAKLIHIYEKLFSKNIEDLIEIKYQELHEKWKENLDE